MLSKFNEIASASDTDLPTDMISNLGHQRSHAEMIEDATITATIKSNLMRSHYDNGLSTDVDTFRSKVTLSGRVDSENARELAGRLAANTLNVVSVDNLLSVSPSKSTLDHNAAIAAANKASDSADSWISTKVRSTFLSSVNITGHGIVVDTRQGEVTLSGRVNSVVERAFAIELAQLIRGVTKVNADILIVA